MRNQIAFISGHRRITNEEFDKHYVPRLDAGMINGDIFLVGDYYGVDDIAQRYMFSKKYPESHIRVYHMFKEPRVCHSTFKVGGFTSDESRDAEMTFASSYDIAWVRPGRENSGTAQNLARRQKQYLMLDIESRRIDLINEMDSTSKKFDEFFQKMHDHLDIEWKKVSGEFVEESEGEL